MRYRLALRRFNNPPGIDGGLFAFLACHRDSHTIQNIFLDSRCSKHIRKFHHVCTQFDFDQYVDRRRRRKEVEEIPDNVPRMIKVYRRGFNALLGWDIKQALYEFTGQSALFLLCVAFGSEDLPMV